MKVAAAVTYSPGREKFLLMRRSPGREKFPGKWEFPSGIVEDEKPVEAALRELKEETGLVGETVREGEPLTVEEEGMKFQVHPVLVIVEDGEVELTREHDDYRWLEMEEIGKLETVPGIKKDLKAVGIDG